MKTSENSYRTPEPLIQQLLAAKGFSHPLLNWAKTALIKIFVEETPAMDYIARPQMKLAGARFNPKNYTSISSFYYKELWYFDMLSKEEKRLDFPEDAILRSVSWSPDGKNLAVSLEQEEAHEVWLVRIPSLEKFKIPAPPLNACLQQVVQWISADEILLGVRTENQKDEVKTSTEKPRGPVIQQTYGEVSQNRTFADLLKTPQEAETFANATEMQFLIYQLSSQRSRRLGPIANYISIDFSPNGKFVLVKKIEKPFSFLVPYSRFATAIEIWNAEAGVLRTLRQGPFESIPIQGVATGPRAFHWMPHAPQSLFYAEALDEGDWNVQAPYRDELFCLKLISPAGFATESLLKLKNRLQDIDYLEKENHYLIQDYERDREWLTTVHLFKQDQQWQTRTIFSLSANNDYDNPGHSISKRNEWGRPVTAMDKQDKDSIYLAGPGASPQGERPFLRRLNLQSLHSEEIFRSEEKTYESFIGFLGDDFKKFLTSFETPVRSPRLLVRDVQNKSHEELLYADKNPYEIFSRLRKEVITYQRNDGVLLSGVLYYPLHYEEGEKYPAIINAYPLEYTDSSTAGQVRGSQDRFVRPFREDVVYNALRGYFVLNRAQMPIIGHPETKNDTFIEQLVAGAEAAVKTLYDKGLIERERVGVIGHSYGAFMVAHLLTHSSLFSTGIAKSGAYNRTLTPFGFQGERRPLWQAKEIYNRLSPFLDADKMKKPILLMHGMIDNNPGTFTMQTERYFEALKGQGAQARLVLLPEESHGYASRETIGHVLVEIFEWFDRYLKES